MRTTHIQMVGANQAGEGFRDLIIYRLCDKIHNIFVLYTYINL